MYTYDSTCSIDPGWSLLISYIYNTCGQWNNAVRVFFWINHSFLKENINFPGWNLIWLFITLLKMSSENTVGVENNPEVCWVFFFRSKYPMWLFIITWCFDHHLTCLLLYCISVSSESQASSFTLRTDSDWCVFTHRTANQKLEKWNTNPFKTDHQYFVYKQQPEYILHRYSVDIASECVCILHKWIHTLLNIHKTAVALKFMNAESWLKKKTVCKLNICH